jgi:hypothetical protein
MARSTVSSIPCAKIAGAGKLAGVRARFSFWLYKAPPFVGTLNAFLGALLVSSQALNPRRYRGAHTLQNSALPIDGIAAGN